MAYGSSHDCQYLIAPQRLILEEWTYLHRRPRLVWCACHVSRSRPSLTYWIVVTRSRAIASRWRHGSGWPAGRWGCRMAAIVVGRKRHAVVRAGAVSLVLFGGRVCACRSLHGRLMVVLRAVHGGGLAWVVHLITMMWCGCASRAAKVPSAGRSMDRGW